MNPLSFSLAAAAMLVVSSQAGAADWVLGAGMESFGSGDPRMGVFSGEVHGTPFAEIAGVDISAGGAATIYANGTFWVGAGVSALMDLPRGWFVEASVMPGYYDSAAVATDLGGDLQIRSLIGLGHAFGNGARLSLALSHKSNADTNPLNPGANALSLRWRQPF